MLTKEDLQAIKELIAESEERTRNNFNAVIETQVMPKLELLAEGHQMIIEIAAPKSKLEEIEEEVEFLKNVVKMLSKEVAELKAG